MLKASYRLTKNADFLRLNRVGRFLHSPFFVLKYAPSGKKENLRFGFIVSKKFDKRATQRNKYKRLLRNCVEKNLKFFNTGFDVLFIFKEKIKGQSHEQISDEFNKVLSKTPLIRTWSS